MPHDYDCLIVGGGLVGASLACALAALPIRIALVEAVPLQADSQPSYDDRGLVIAPASKRILDALGLWSALLTDAMPIRRIHVSDRGHFGFARLDAESMGVDALGHVVVGRHLGEVLLNQINRQPNIDFLCPARVDTVQVDAGTAEVQLMRDGKLETINSRLLVVADGGDSVARQQLGVTTNDHDYEQTAVVANVTPERASESTAYERFTASGPLAILPLRGHRCVAVWAVPTSEAQGLLDVDDDTFLARLSERFGYRLGRFVKVGRRRAYPLRLRIARQLVGPRFVVIGNAAHTIHPNAAQGLNLGLRDAAALAECVADALRAEEDIGSSEWLNRYAAMRVDDHRSVTRLSDGLTRIFYNEIQPLIVLRNLAMVAIDMIPPVKHRLMLHAMGLVGRQPRLVRGLPL